MVGIATELINIALIIFDYIHIYALRMIGLGVPIIFW